MSVMKDKHFVLEFIEAYRSLPALWNIKSKDYSNRHLKNEQYEMLLLKYKEKFPEASKKDMTQKINILRTNYRRELKRILALEKSGAGISEENDPTLFYFEAMDFMRDNEKSCASRSSLSCLNETEEVETPRKRKNADSSVKLIALATKRLTQPRDELKSIADTWALKLQKLDETPRKRKNADSSVKLIALATKRLTQPKDEFKNIADTWALKLKKLDETQRILAEKFINEILFEGQMGTLHRNAMHLNVDCGPSPSYQANYSRSALGSSSSPGSSYKHISPNIQSSASEFSYIDENLGSVSPQNPIEVWDTSSEQAEEFSPQNKKI